MTCTIPSVYTDTVDQWAAGVVVVFEEAQQSELASMGRQLGMSVA
jgi:hypothetical protein